MLKRAISIAAGHGGYDYGVVGTGGVMEKEATLALAEALKESMDRTGAFDIFLIRDDDSYISTEKRAHMAEQWGSECHLEIHLGSFAGCCSHVRVFYAPSAHSEEPLAGEIARAAAQALGDLPSYTRAYEDLSRYFRTQAENYRGIFRLLSRSVPHVFFLECGCLDDPDTERKLSRESGICAAADAVASVLCEAFRIPFVRQQERRDRRIPYHRLEQYLRLKSGIFRTAAGPGDGFPAVRAIGGLIHTGFCGYQDGWYKISPEYAEYVHQSAVRATVTLPGSSLPAGSPEWRELKDGLFYVRDGKSGNADVMGVVRGGVSLPAVEEERWMMFSFGEQVGYIPESAWK